MATNAKRISISLASSSKKSLNEALAEAMILEIEARRKLIKPEIFKPKVPKQK